MQNEIHLLPSSTTTTRRPPTSRVTPPTSTTRGNGRTFGNAAKQPLPTGTPDLDTIASELQSLLDGNVSNNACIDVSALWSTT